MGRFMRDTLLSVNHSSIPNSRMSPLLTADYGYLTKTISSPISLPSVPLLPTLYPKEAPRLWGALIDCTLSKNIFFFFFKAELCLSQ